MSSQEIALSWERAKRLAERIWEAYVTGIGVAQAKKDQKSLQVWVNLVRENGIIYNGCFDEYLELNLDIGV